MPMFFMIGVTPGQKFLDYNQTIICDDCGSYGRYRVYVTYMVLTLFFIPVFKWGKRYFVQTTCCNRTYALNANVGRDIERGRNVEITPGDLYKSQAGYRPIKICRRCGFRTEEDFEFCPKCGERF